MCVRRTFITGALILTFPCVFTVCVVLTGKMREKTSSFHSKATTTASSLEKHNGGKTTRDRWRHLITSFHGPLQRILNVQSEKIVHFICQLNWKTSRCGSLRSSLYWRIAHRLKKCKTSRRSVHFGKLICWFQIQANTHPSTSSLHTHTHISVGGGGGGG